MTCLRIDPWTVLLCCMSHDLQWGLTAMADEILCYTNTHMM